MARMEYIPANSGRRITLAGGHIFEILHLTAGDDASLALTVVAPNTALERHRHAVATEVYLGVAGRGCVLIGDTTVPFGPGDVLRIDPGEAHHAEASEIGLQFHALTLPAYDPKDHHPIRHTP